MIKQRTKTNFAFCSFIIFTVSACLFMSACATPVAKAGQGNKISSGEEPEWIRNGEPIDYEGNFWYPRDGVEILLEDEILLIGNYRGVDFFY